MKPLPFRGPESVMTGVLLSLAGGYLDSYTFLLKDGVFANAQTGNVVLLAMSLTNPGSWHFVKYLWPLVAFAGGIACVEAFRDSRRSLGMVGAVVLLLEALILLLLIFWSPVLGQSVTVTAVSFVAALQVQTFRKVKEAPYATTMITGNLRSGIEALFHGLKYREPDRIRKAGLYGFMVAGFAAGALVGALLCSLWGDGALGPVCGILVVGAALSLQEKKGKAV